MSRPTGRWGIARDARLFVPFERWFIYARLVVLLAAAVVAACGGDDGSGASTGDGSGNTGGGSTSAPPAAPSQLAATDVTSTSILLVWSDNSSDENAFELERRAQSEPAGSYALIATLAADSTSYQDDDVAPSTSYIYRLKATNAAGDSAYTEELGVSSDAEPVAAPTNLSSVSVTHKTVELAWTDNASNETEYHVERRDTALGFGFNLREILPAGTSSYTDDVVSPDSTYFYRVQALSDAAASDYSNEISVTTPSAPPPPTDVFARSYFTEFDTDGNDVIQTPDGGYLMVGRMLVQDSIDGDLLVVKTDPAGSIEWTRAFDHGQTDAAYAASPTPDGGYIVVGAVDVHKRVWVLKLDAAGDLEWEKTFGAAGDCYGFDVTTVDSDGDGIADDGYVIVGRSTPIGPQGIAIRLDAQGDVLWQQNLETLLATAYSVKQAADGNFVVAGEVTVESKHSAYWLLKLDDAGAIVWQRALSPFETADSATAQARAVIQTDDDGDGDADDGYLVVGYADFDASSSIRYDAWVVKLTEAGDILWQKRYGEPNFGERVTDAELDADGNLVITGSAHNRLLYLKLDPAGSVLLQRTYGFSGDSGKAIAATIDGGVIHVGSISIEARRRDAWLLKLDETGDIEFAPGNNFSMEETALVASDTTATSDPATAFVVAISGVGSAAVPTVTEPVVEVATQSF